MGRPAVGQGKFSLIRVHGVDKIVGRETALNRLAQRGRVLKVSLGKFQRGMI
jgi:hypothetical protein